MRFRCIADGFLLGLTLHFLLFAWGTANFMDRGKKEIVPKKLHSLSLSGQPSSTWISAEWNKSSAVEDVQRAPGENRRECDRGRIIKTRECKHRWNERNFLCHCVAGFIPPEKRTPDLTTNAPITAAQCVVLWALTIISRDPKASTEAFGRLLQKDCSAKLDIFRCLSGTGPA